MLLSWTDPGDSLIVDYQYRVGVSTDTGIDWDEDDTAPEPDSGGEVGWRTVGGSHSGTTNVAVTTLFDSTATGSVGTVLVNGTEYVFEVRARYADSPEDTDTVEEAGPAAQITATAGNPLANFRTEPASKSVTLRWDNPGDSAINYYEYRYRTVSATDGTASGDYEPASVATDDDTSWSRVTGDGSVTSYTVTGLTDGVEYEFEVRADGTDQGRDSEIKASAGKPLTGFTATAAGNKVTLAWNYPGSNTDIASYEFRYSGNKGVAWTVATGGSGGWQPANEGAVTGVTGVSVDLADGSSNSGSLTTFDVNGLGIGNEYVFQIRATGTTTPAVLTTFGVSDKATVKVGSGLSDLVAMPGNVSVIISWGNPGDAGIAHYAYGVTAPTATAPAAWEDLPGTSSQTTNYKVDATTDAVDTTQAQTPLANGSEVTIWVRTETRTGLAQGLEAKATFVVGMPLTGLAAVPGDKRVTLSWNSPTYPPGDPAAPVTSYEYRQSVDGGKSWVNNPDPAKTHTDGDEQPWETLASGSTVSAAVTGLTNGRTYTFQIRATPDTTDDHGFGASNLATAAAGVVSKVPVITGIAPSVPADNNMPVVSGVNAGDRATVSIFTSATCDGTAVATGTADRDGNFSVTVEVDDNSSTTFYAAGTPRGGGNLSACSPAGMTYVEDSAGPVTTINGGPDPDSETEATSATFFLTASEVGSTFEYSLDGEVFQTTGPVVSLSALEPGMHTLRVQATDGADNTGEVASVTWTIVEPAPPPPPPDPRGCTVMGTDGDDNLVGTEGDDVICGLGGNDVIRGLGGNDVIYGDAGGDTISGGSGDDRIYGGSGNDRIWGNAGDDMIRGGGGIDMIRGGKGDDTIYGNAGDDTIYGERGSDTIHGGPGNDTAMVGPGDKARAVENRL